MPVNFLTATQREAYGRYARDPTADELDRYFHFDDTDHGVIGAKRGDHNRLGFALQLATARFLGTFLEDPLQVPSIVVQTLARQLQVTRLDQLPRYRTGDQRWELHDRGTFRRPPSYSRRGTLVAAAWARGHVRAAGPPG